MRSAIYRGHVWHSRVSPVPHAFRKAMHLAYLDLEEVPGLFRGRLFWSIERWNWISFRRADYLGPSTRPLREAVLDRVEQHLGRRPSGNVALLTQLRTLGYLFNPVSFYFCHDATGQLDSIVAEITNTPWGERHSYVLDAVAGADGDGKCTFRFRKDFHVSPFFDMDQEYEWQFSTRGDRILVSMTNTEAGRAVFRAGLTSEREAITRSSLARALIRYPLQPLRMHASIYWHAARLWLKRAPFFTHPAKREAALDTPTP